ncbi:gamma-glutamyl-gamma-aminobutyrate hydrolase family protein [Paenibacillus sp. CC-CFT747]|nr:gamma-glutamyl-gamma-aminobutyrate hydrolase family protein [Paenibacillus sp. CC-CFT747]
MLSGGTDLDPAYFGEEPHPKLGEVVPDRDRAELLLLDAYLQARKPVLGICRGCQVMNAALGGTLLQDIPSQCPDALQHTQKAPRSHGSHLVRIREGSRLHGILGALEIRVNSFHHQAVRRAAPGLTVTAHALDGIVEAVERPGPPFFVGVQWHPEDMAGGDRYAAALFQSLVEACFSDARNKKTRES